MNVNVYITNHRNKTVALPVSPSEIKVNFENDESTSKVIGLGEINRLGDKKLKSIKISSFLPLDSSKVSYTTVRKKHKWKNASSYITFLKNIQASKKPCRLVITGFKFSMKATINFTYGMSNGVNNEYTYELDFTEYRKIKAERIGKKHGRKNNKIAKHGQRRSKPQHKINRGSKVLVNGMAYLTKNAIHGVMIRKRECNITLVSSNAKHPYYVVTTGGVAMGWVSKGAFI
ncbi:hypothetical protein [Apilactobacillus timberlakei]|uniref:Uncharacterized protein n=1 Tax=Apilactobacillus timberlakei TaxID=2008380 RepID=A0ABY2YST1_9LACO|nr:hypothetical protein [Apilactobacillus timberlakei]TPR12401.1 hypothetical protein DY048_07570 [Apilactobacillus timberlakei]TPR12987.1 hypothetical protein DY052_08730 [Apilactobacillus timberlakei]